MISALPWEFSLLEVTITRGKAPVQASFRAAWHCSGVRFSTTSLEMAQSSCGVVKTLSRAALWAMAEELPLEQSRPTRMFLKERVGREIR